MDAIKCKTFLADPSINPLTGRKIDPTGATAKKLQKECKGLVAKAVSPKAASPKAASPKPKAPSPKPKAASPKPKAASPKPKAASPKMALDPRLRDQVIVFSGFRSKEIEASLATVNCKVATSISKKTLLVVAKDPSDVTGKVAKAREYGIPVLSLDAFKEQYMSSVAAVAAAAAAPAKPKTQSPARMPNIWTYDPSQYDNESEYMDDTDKTEKYFTSIKNKTVPGDYIVPEDGYRGAGVMIVGLNKKLMAPEPHGNGEVSFPAKAFKMLLDQGMTVDDVIKTYKQSQFTFLIYPMSHQKKLVHKKKGPWSGKLRVYDIHGEFSSKGGDAEVDLDEFDFWHTWDEMGLGATR